MPLQDLARILDGSKALRIAVQATITLIARARGDPLSEIPAVRERIRAVDPHAFVTDIRSMDQRLAGSQAEPRAGTLLVSAFGAMALVLVVAGRL